jgi:type II secretory ATPase GspE/PulE/Tfp pilus assembly ATPase PilB-like protein
MLAGTFNLVMAQRLVRTICPNCKSEQNIKNDPKYQASKKSFTNFDKDKLKIEIISRGITQEQRDKFINE